MRADVAGYLNVAAFELRSRFVVGISYRCDAEWRKTLFTVVADVGSQVSQGINQNLDRTVLHALCAGEQVAAAPSGCQKGSHESHGCASSLDIDNLWHVAQGTDNDFGVIAVAEVLG